MVALTIFIVNGGSIFFLRICRVDVVPVPVLERNILSSLKSLLARRGGYRVATA
jgi:hypothetical protein